MKQACERKTAVAIGPGMGLEPSTQQLIRDVISNIELPMVIDADGLNALAAKPEILLKRKVPTILTPHPGEMARLIGSDVGRVKTDRIGVAREFAKQYGCYLVLKGARSIIATPEGHIYINPTGNPGMASGGTGDVLTGIIAGFLAEGMNPLEAAIAGVYIHGACGDAAAMEYGERGLLARDMIAELPRLLRELEEEAVGKGPYDEDVED
ncbi:MAG TPA: NAD(P)H-hydrate dehydratase [Proteobacteria bacterium]|nr:NAD(P)H-hydrate dehydratase [Pseudomonadota bacterium]